MLSVHLHVRDGDIWSARGGGVTVPDEAVKQYSILTRGSHTVNVIELKFNWIN